MYVSNLYKDATNAHKKKRRTTQWYT